MLIQIEETERKLEAVTRELQQYSMTQIEEAERLISRQTSCVGFCLSLFLWSTAPSFSCSCG